nr:MAG TPA: hypothetical protein [Caudoviricetes sp.]
MALLVIKQKFLERSLKAVCSSILQTLLPGRMLEKVRGLFCSLTVLHKVQM